LPLAALESSAACLRGPTVDIAADLRDDRVQRARDRVRLAARDVLRERLSVDLAARLPEPAGERFRAVKQVVGDRDRRLHTKSITSWTYASGSSSTSSRAMRHARSSSRARP